MTWLLFTALGANQWGPLWLIKQHNPVKEGHLALLLNLHMNLLLYLYLDLGRSAVWAPCLLVFSVSAQWASPWLLGLALLHLVSPLSTAEALDLTWVTIHKDWHFYWSVQAWGEWCRFGGRLYWDRERPLQLVLDQTVEVGMLDMILGGNQVVMDA